MELKSSSRRILSIGKKQLSISLTRSTSIEVSDEEILPIGSIFLAIVDTNPAELLGFGTWEAFATGSILVGIDPTDPDFNTIEKTGGTKTKTPTGSNINEGAHTHNVTTNVSVENHDSHTHNVSPPFIAGMSRSGSKNYGSTRDHFHPASSVEDSPLVHTVNNDEIVSNTGSSHTHDFTGDDINILQPYIVVHIWKRTA
jgi:hypothetical protein